jgi:putative PIN family toxin of toxin-antitoxin system
VTPHAIIDTNVVISGLLGRDSGSPTAVILNAMLAGRFTYLLSVDLLAEYHRVILRPAIRRRHGLAEAEIDVILTELALNGALVETLPSPTELPDEGDRHPWDLLDTAAGSILVTGDDALQKRVPDPARVLSPRQFVTLL